MDYLPTARPSARGSSTHISPEKPQTVTTMNRKLVSLLLALALIPAAHARTHTVRLTQYLLSPNPEYTFFGRKVAIDGGSIIALADREGGRVALWYRRGADGQWTFQRKLLDVTAAPEQLRDGLEMKNGIAVIQLAAGMTTVWESAPNDWVQGRFAATPPLAGGFAISGTRIIGGRNGCNYDALIYEKAADGAWTIAGQINGAVGACNDHGAQVELNYDYALVRNPANEVRVYRKNGAALQWPQVGAFTLPAATGQTFGPLALQKAVAISPGSGIFRRTGSTWNYEGQLQPIDYGNGTGHAGQVKYRDGVLLTTESWSEMHAYSKVYAYVENASGVFDHAGILETPGYTQDMDISGNTVVVGTEDIGGEPFLSVFTLPAPLVAPAAITNDFNAHDVSGFQQTSGSQFALAGNVYNYLYRQSSTTGESVAVLTDSDWHNYQSVEADITPTAFDGADRYVGLAVRYLDIGNNYYVTWRSSGVLALKRKIDGAFVTLAEKPMPLALNVKHRLRLSIDAGNYLQVQIDGFQQLFAHDTQLTHGKAALLTNRARADFDNVYASPTASVNINYNDWVFYWYGFGRPFTTLGGNWQITGQDDPEGMSQTTTTGLALAYNGVGVVDDQMIRSNIRLDSFAGSQSGAWFGLLARYVDESNYYFLSVRSSNQLQIRKIVNGVTTVLRAVSYTAAPGAMHEYTFSVVGNELHAFVDGQLVATALDDALPRGKYGMGTYRAAATWQDYVADQP
jgi:hypothetical protein